jgi:ABC-2 type transport system ATP-binding protein
MEVVRALDVAHVEPTDFTVREPTLDDVFLALTGHAATEETIDDDTADERRPTSRGAA